MLGNGDLDPFLSYCIRYRQKQALQDAQRRLARGDVKEFLDVAFGDVLRARNLMLAKIEALKEVVGHDQHPLVLERQQVEDTPTTTKPIDKGPLLSNVASEWYLKKLRLGEWTENTRTEHEAALKMFAQIFGDKPIGMYEKADGRRFKDVLLRLPSNAHKKPQFKDLTLLEAVEKADGISGLELLSPVTINKLIRKVSAFFSYCMSAFDECNSNPMAGQTDRTRQIQAEDRDPFTLTQLQTIFSSPIYHGCKSEARW